MSVFHDDAEPFCMPSRGAQVCSSAAADCGGEEALQVLLSDDLGPMNPLRSLFDFFVKVKDHLGTSSPTGSYPA